MSKTMRMYRLIDSVMMYSKTEGNKDLPYETVKNAVIGYCDKHPKLSFKTHVGDDHAARQIASNLSGIKIW
ncbi:MAG: hypothetical protein MJZ11_07920 [Lachnospiraceae bacterium]|nr:hypothetical protein [Lachnospiraceae bacterium]